MENAQENRLQTLWKGTSLPELKKRANCAQSDVTSFRLAVYQIKQAYLTHNRRSNESEVTLNELNNFLDILQKEANELSEQYRKGLNEFRDNPNKYANKPEHQPKATNPVDELKRRMKQAIKDGDYALVAKLNEELMKLDRN